MLVLAALVMILVFAFVSLTVDVGYIAYVKTQLQNAADAAAMGSVMELKQDGLQSVLQSNARLVAVELAQTNLPTYGEILRADDIVLGQWDFDTQTFTETADDATAIRVTVRRAEANNNPLALFFAPILGIDDAGITVTATASIESDGTVDVIPLSLRDAGFGPIDPGIAEVNPGKNGPSSPANGDTFRKGERVTLFIFGDGKKPPVHLALDIDTPNPGSSQADVKKVLRDVLDGVPVSIGDEFQVFNDGSGSASYGVALQQRLREPWDSPARDVMVPVVEELPGSRNEKGQIDGTVGIVDFVRVHLDEVVVEQLPDPNKAGRTIRTRLMIGTVLDDQGEPAPGSPRGRSRLVQ